MGFCLLDWSAWRRIPRMRWAETGSFLATAVLVLFVNAVAAIAIGCTIHFADVAWQRMRSMPGAGRQLVRAGE
jgi:SulP family sulfate permease